MKKLLPYIIGLMSCATLDALPVGNPADPQFFKAGILIAEPDCWSVELGYRGDFVHDRKLRIKDPALSFNRHVDTFDFQVNAGQLTLNLWNRVELYGWAGEVQAGVNSEAAFTFPTLPGFFDITRFEGTTKGHAAYGVGIKALLWECGHWAVGLGVQYETFNGRFKEAVIFNDLTAPGLLPLVIIVDDPRQFRFNYHEWQADLALSYRVCFLSPYIAVKYSNVRSKISGTDLTDFTEPISLAAELRSRQYWGGAVGLTLIDADRMQVTAEYRFADECALSILADFRF